MGFNQPDSAWTVAYKTASVTNYPGLAPMNAPVVTCSTQTPWITHPMSQWVMLNNTGIIDVPSNATPYDYGYGIARQFKVCRQDSFKFTFNIASDDYIAAIAVNADTVYTQPVNNPMSSMTMFNTIPVFYKVLQPGIHKVFIKVFNYPSNFVFNNPTGINFRGTIQSATGKLSLVSGQSNMDCSCPTNALKSTAKPVQLLVAPNPVNHLLTITATKDVLNQEVQIINLQGQIVKTVLITNTVSHVSVAELPPATYLLVMKGTDVAVTRFTKL